MATAAVAVGCGGVPGNAVAEVDGSAIDKEEFDHWTQVVARSSGQPNASVPDAPDYVKCVAQKRKTTPAPAKGQPKTTDAQLKDQCKQEYEAVRDQALQILVSFQWIEGEAEERGIKVSDAEVTKSFNEQKKQSFPKDADFQKFLKDSGQTEADIKRRVELDLLSTKIRDAVIKGKDKVSNAQVEDFYEKNQERFAQPERRDLRIVLTKGEAKADQARAALASGESWKTVAKQYSVDDASKSQGGKLAAQAEGTLEKALDKAAFNAKKGELTGPIKTQFGYYVFEVTKVAKASQQTLVQAKETITETLKSQNQQKALDSFVTDFRKKWKERTECRDGYEMQDCKGAKATATPTPAAPGETQTVPE
ncbi:MAG: peptidyl-prolyl cis-trans isomerase [Actinomycetota bacterium]|nr:peptidyl-prolyl cis-trans isomerase [Actinomycetota bacterium]